MKAFIILSLLIPSLALAFVEGLPYRETELCKRMASNFAKTRADLSKAVSDFSKTITAGYKTHAVSEAHADLSEAQADEAKTLADAIKHKCFNKQSPACIEFLKNLSKAYANGSKAYADKAQAVSDSDYSKAVTASSKATDDIFNAILGIRKYCGK